MKLSHLEHYLIQADDLEATRRWYVDVLGMREGPHPDFGFPVHWLYIGERDVLHLTQGGAGVSAARQRYLGQESEATRGSGVIDHVAFRATGLDATIAHLRYQLFLFDPNGVKVELNFAAAEAEGRRAEVMAHS
jgi:catechol 2,3-dioxygenase-like lactoylglutathione lyase family enzyme